MHVFSECVNILNSIFRVAIWFKTDRYCGGLNLASDRLVEVEPVFWTYVLLKIVGIPVGIFIYIRTTHSTLTIETNEYFHFVFD